MADKIQIKNPSNVELFPRTTLDNIVLNASGGSATRIESGGKLKPDYMALANSTTSSGIIFNNDSDHLTITSGGLSINTYTTDISGATIAADLKKIPTVSAVKEFVSNYAGTGTEVMAGVISPEYANHVIAVYDTHPDIGGYYGAKHVYYTYPAEPNPNSSSEYQADLTSRGLGGHLVGCVQVYYVDNTHSNDKPCLYVRIHHVDTEHEDNVILRTVFPNDLSQSNMLEVPVNVIIPPNCEFEVVMNQGVSQEECEEFDGAGTETPHTLEFIPNIGIAVTGTTIQNTIVTDVE